MGDAMLLVALTSEDEDNVGFRASAADAHGKKKKRSPHPNVLRSLLLHKLNEFDVRHCLRHIKNFGIRNETHGLSNVTRLADDEQKCTRKYRSNNQCWTGFA